MPRMADPSRGSHQLSAFVSTYPAPLGGIFFRVQSRIRSKDVNGGIFLRWGAAAALLVCAALSLTAYGVRHADPDKAFYLDQLAQTRGESYAQGYAQMLKEYEPRGETADLVFFGDSLTYRGDWQALSQTLKIANRGIDGDRIDGLEARLDQVVALRPRKLFLLVGINDLSERAPREVCADYAGLLDRLQQAMPETRIYVQSLLPVRTDIRTLPDNRLLEQVNRSIRQMAEERGLEYIDLFFPLLDQSSWQLAYDYQLDGLHLSKEGYAVWQEKVLPFITESEPSRKPAPDRPDDRLPGRIGVWERG
ncbi:hypothetical protein D1157_09105 [Anaerotruncus sp. X29]|nr:hypothetical protein [Anaerotruncus sp. X29]